MPHSGSTGNDQPAQITQLRKIEKNFAASEGDQPISASQAAMLRIIVYKLLAVNDNLEGGDDVRVRVLMSLIAPGIGVGHALSIVNAQDMHVLVIRQICEELRGYEEVLGAVMCRRGRVHNQ